MRRSRDEVGAMGGIEGLVFGVLVFVFGTLVIVNAWGVIDAKMAASNAAREAARAYVEAPTQNAAEDDATDAATTALNGHNRQLSGIEFSAVGANDFRRCGPVAVTVHTKVNRVPLPLLGGVGGVFVVSANHTEVVDPYRSGLPGIAECS